MIFQNFKCKLHHEENLNRIFLLPSPLKKVETFYTYKKPTTDINILNKLKRRETSFIENSCCYSLMMFSSNLWQSASQTVPSQNVFRFSGLHWSQSCHSTANRVYLDGRINGQVTFGFLSSCQSPFIYTETPRV
mgnify:FL=1